MTAKPNTTRSDVYSRITDKTVADLEQGVRSWLKPWNADHAARCITRPLRHNGIPYKGINIVRLRSASVAKGYAAPLWLTFMQAQVLGAHVRKGETGELVVYADRITLTETDEKGEETEREIPQGLHRVRCGTNNRPARALLREDRTGCPHALAAD